jgi:hypothetical protein
MGTEAPPLPNDAPWLLLVHQLPPQPAYFRVKIWRRLQALGAVGIKNAVYVLPATEQAREDFAWLLREIADGGGEAFVCAACFLDGLQERQVRELFAAAREADYGAIAAEARALAEALAADPDRRGEASRQLARLRRQLGQVAAIDFFGAAGRVSAERLLADLEERLASPGGARPADARDLAGRGGRTWVTRADVHVDRIASAWLIRRFIDPRARFRFVTDRNHAPEPGEIRFDMFDGEVSHEGDACTFEVLLARARLDDAALRAIGEIVHDIDLKDGKFGREEAAGVAHLIAGIALAHADDGERCARGAALLDDLYAYFRGSSR